MFSVTLLCLTNLLNCAVITLRQKYTWARCRCTKQVHVGPITQ